MSAEDENKTGLVPSQSAPLASSRATFLVQRGVRDLVARAQADALCSEGQQLWKQEEYERAIECFTRALVVCPQHPALLFWMGKACELNPPRLALNPREAGCWYRRSAELGFIDAHTALGDLYYLDDIEQAMRWFRSAAEIGGPEEEFNYACVLCESDDHPCPKNTEAVCWFLRAAERGHKESQHALGYAFSEGWITKDYAKAAFWWRRAAEQGDKDAQYRLGRAYDLGQGVPQDYVQAAYWYRRAAVQGHDDAERFFGNAYMRAASEGLPPSPGCRLNLDHMMKLEGMLRKAGLDGLEEVSDMSVLHQRIFREFRELRALFKDSETGD